MRTSLQAIPLPNTSGIRRTFALDCALVVAASAFVALCAHISLPLLFTPVPLTLGNFAVLLVGLALGPRLGFSALALYLVEGASGLPVFNPGGLGGVAQLFGPTGGYLLAYPAAAALAGALAGALRPRVGALLAGLSACLFATTLLMASGVAWLSRFAHLSAPAALAAGLLPFLPGELLKVTVAAGIYRTLARTGRSERQPHSQGS